MQCAIASCQATTIGVWGCLIAGAALLHARLRTAFTSPADHSAARCGCLHCRRRVGGSRTASIRISTLKRRTRCRPYASRSAFCAGGVVCLARYLLHCQHWLGVGVLRRAERRGRWAWLQQHGEMGFVLPAALLQFPLQRATHCVLDYTAPLETSSACPPTHCSCAPTPTPTRPTHSSRAGHQPALNHSHSFAHSHPLPRSSHPTPPTHHTPLHPTRPPTCATSWRRPSWNCRRRRRCRSRCWTTWRRPRSELVSGGSERGWAGVIRWEERGGCRSRCLDSLEAPKK